MTVEHLRTMIAWLFVYAGLPLAWVSVVLHWRTPWRDSEMGRHLFAYALILAVIFTFASARYWTKPAVWPHWLEVIHLLTYVVLIGVVMPWRVWLQIAAARRS